MNAGRRSRAAGDNPVDNVWPAVPLVLFDADCGFCTASVRVAQGPLLRARIDATPYQSTDLLVHNLTVDKCAEALHCVDTDGGVAVGSDAVAMVLLASRGPWPVAGHVLRLPGVRRVAGWVYAVVAGNRHRLPGATESCALPDTGSDPSA